MFSNIVPNTFISQSEGKNWSIAPEPGFIQILAKWWQWKYLFVVIFVFEATRMYKMFLLRPKNIKIIGMPTIVGQWITGLTHMFNAQSIVSVAYKNAKGDMWAIPARDKFHICVSSQEQIEEYNSASQQKISLQGAVHELFPPYELYGGMPAGDKYENLGLSQGIFRHSLRSHLRQLQPVIRKTMEEGFRTLIQSDKKDKDGWMNIPLYYTTYRLSARLNSLVIVGKQLSSDANFSKSLQRYLKMATIVEELLRVTPSILKTILGNIIMRSFGGITEIRQKLSTTIEERVLSRAQKSPDKSADCIQWSLDRSRKSSIQDLTTHILAMLFASTHQLPVLISFAIYRLCLHPEYLAPLREETEHCSGNNHDTQNKDMPLLDSFLKEVARLHPITVVSMPHKVEVPFTFSNGRHIPPGNWVCIPQQAIMQDSSIYPSSLQFQGFRFVNWESGSSPACATSKTRFSHPGHIFPYWGTLKQACPARFYVSMVSKMIIAQFITNYDIKLANPKAPVTFNWGLSTVPHPRLTILVRERK